MKYDSVIFDLDGTLLDTLGDLCDSINFALGSMSMPERSLDEVRAFVGNGVRNLAMRAAPEGTDDRAVDELLAIFKEHYSVHGNEKTKPYDGVIPLLTRLKELGIPTAVVSNKIDSAVQTLVAEHFNGLIDVAIGELLGVKRKPAPDTVLLAMDRLGAVCPLYVGDSEVDVETARNAGLDGVFVTWGFRSEQQLRQAGAQYTVGAAEELSRRLV